MKKPSAVVVLLVVFAQIAFPVPSRSCGIVMSIWTYIDEAETIALVRIERLDAHELSASETEPAWPVPRKRTAAELRVLERFKGDTPATISVDLGEDYGSMRWKVGDVFVALLQRGAERAAREREFESYQYEHFEAQLDENREQVQEDFGFPRSSEDLEKMRRDSVAAHDAFEAWMANRWSLFNYLRFDEYSEETDFEAARDVVRLAVELQADGSDDAERLDWHIAAAAHRATRGEGLIDLYYLLDFRSAPMEVNVPEDESEVGEEEPVSEDVKLSSEELAKPELSREQLRRLAEGFAREPAVDETDLTMLRLLAPYPDLEVDRAAASVIEAGLRLRPIPEWVTEMVDEALKRYGDNFADRIGRDDVDSRGRPIYTGEGENTLPTIWEVARRDLGIPVVAPIQLPTRPQEDAE
jgi:hypothetical protein